MSRPLIFFCLFVALAGAGAPRVYKNDALHVRAFEAPAGWELAPQSSYPRLLASYSHHEGGKLTLSAQKVPVGLQPVTLAEQSRGPLEKQGFTALRIKVEDGRARLEADLDGGKRFLKQIYLVQGNFGYVVTLIAPLAAAGRMTEDFEETVRSLVLGAPATPASPPDGGAAPP